MKRLVLLNPYSTGSHALWEEGMRVHLPQAAESDGEALEVLVWSLPGRHWKWRMHASALSLVERMMSDWEGDWIPDGFLVTDMMDVGQFRAALPSRMRQVPIVLYFHENQLTFPDHLEREAKTWDRHYAFLNLTSALLADAVWFNSAYHRTAFLGAIPEFLKCLPSPRPVDAVERIAAHSEVVPIGIQEDVFSAVAERADVYGEGAPVVVWNHRWEYDKGPDAFLEVLEEAKRRGARFRIAVMGEPFDAVPDSFERMKSVFADDVVHWGRVETRSEYVRRLCAGDIALVTARHDFFGISVLESAAAGLDIVAPNALVYPEHFGAARLHDREGLCDALIRTLSEGGKGEWKQSAAPYAWPEVADWAWNSLLRVWESSL